nr:NAD-glutamate dehydrogenase domain-containing protein [Nocardioides piscis]
MDNSAGVDTSDHEVNIKVLLDKVVAAGEMTREQRNTLLAEMTDEVAGLVLRDNYEQNLALANAAAHAPALLHVHEDWMKDLERRGVLNRELEALPSSRQVRHLLDRGESLSVPELSVLLSWTKIVLADELLASDLPDDPYLREDLLSYFPPRMRADHVPAMEDHPLRREIIVTQVVNDLVNGAGMTFIPRLAGETGASVADLTRANFVAREIFDSLPLREEIASYDNQVPAERQTRMRIEMRTLVERASRWLVNNRRQPLDSTATVEFFQSRVQSVMQVLPQIMSGQELDDFVARRDRLTAQHVPDDLATRVAVLAPAYALLGIIETADEQGLDPADVARVHFALGERLGLPTLVHRIFALPRDDRWQTMARAAVRDDLYAVHQQLTAAVLASTDTDESAPARVATWEESETELIARSAATLEEICRDESADLARLSVGLRVVRGLLATN